MWCVPVPRGVEGADRAGVCFRHVAGQFYEKYLKPMMLNDHFVEFTKLDLSYLRKVRARGVLAATIRLAWECVPRSVSPSEPPPCKSEVRRAGLPVQLRLISGPWLRSCLPACA